MPVTIKVNGTNLSLVHKFSNGISTATIPDVCKTPTPGGPVPMPYPNIAQSITLSNGTTTVKGDKMMAATKGSKFALSNGDQAGTIGGVKSNVFMKEATWILYSFNVKLNGKNACRFTDKMFHNSENAANLAGEIQGPVAAVSGLSEECQGLDKAADEQRKELPPSLQNKATTVTTGVLQDSSGNAMPLRAFSRKLAGKYTGQIFGWAMGIVPGAASNIPGFQYVATANNFMPKSSHAEARIIEDIFSTLKKIGKSPQGYKLTLRIRWLSKKGMQHVPCPHCEKMIDAARNAGLQVEIC